MNIILMMRHNLKKIRSVFFYSWNHSIRLCNIYCHSINLFLQLCLSWKDYFCHRFRCVDLLILHTILLFDNFWRGDQIWLTFSGNFAYVTWINLINFEVIVMLTFYFGPNFVTKVFYRLAQYFGIRFGWNFQRLLLRRQRWTFLNFLLCFSM